MAHRRFYRWTSKRTAWDILGVSREEKDRDIIKKEYRRLAMLLHPDINPSKSATQEMQLLNEAYDAVLRELELSERAS
jgi:curved DNA-binding protein CbpA